MKNDRAGKYIRVTFDALRVRDIIVEEPGHEGLRIESCVGDRVAVHHPDGTVILLPSVEFYWLECAR